jgi:hypothetical protein
MYTRATPKTSHAFHYMMVLSMSFYWEPASTQKKSRSNGTRIIAVIIILMIIVSTGLALFVYFGQQNIGPREQVRVAVLDSGINVDFSLAGRVVAEQSFVTLANGYNASDTTTTDSKPDNVSHGTLVAKQIATSTNTLILNGKILDSGGSATTMALIDAIHWAVEQNASVINLSLGAAPTYGDPTEQAIDWAFSLGVVVVVAAGNSGDNGIPGTCIESPSVFLKCLSVGALTDTNEPTYFTSTGPTHDLYMKPDISALGYTTGSDGTRYYGTSFSAPRVSAATAELIGYCMANNITWSPGSIMTALLKGADVLPGYQSYEVGAGKLNLQGALDVILAASSPHELPAISYAFPGTLPINFVKLFEGDTYTFNIRLFTSGSTTFTTVIGGLNTSMFIIDHEIDVNQTALVPVKVEVPQSGVSNVVGMITFSSPDFGTTSVGISFSVGTPVARVAFDISHSPWDIDTIYGQFREFYKEMVYNNISVTEIRNSTATTLAVLQQFDAVVLLDPFAYGTNETDPEQVDQFSIPFSTSERQAYEDYFNGGGGLFVVGLSDTSINRTDFNDFLNWTGFSMTQLEVPPGNTPVIISDISPHTITLGINGFHYLGATLVVPTTTNGTILARYEGMPVMGCDEGTGGGRIVVTGSNFMIDNWGLLGQYGTPNDNAYLAYRIVLWCAGKL